MTRAAATEIAEEQIAYWRARGITASLGWGLLGMPTCGAETWPLVRNFLVRWLLAHAEDVRER